MNPQKQEAEQLLNQLLPLAKTMLMQYGEFYPYGRYMKPTGEIVEVGATDPDTDRPRSKDLVYFLQTSLREVATRGRCKAAAIVFNVHVKMPTTDERTDAIQVRVEHVGGYSAEVFFPYKLTGGAPVFGQTFAQQGDFQIFERL